MGFWRDLGEATGILTPTGSLEDIGRTGIDCLDRSIDRAVRDEMRLERARQNFYNNERKKKGEKT